MLESPMSSIRLRQGVIMRAGSKRRTRTASALRSMLLLLLSILSMVLVNGSDENDNASNGHPDPNLEDYEGMIYVGRMEDSSDGSLPRRLSADHDHTVRLLFGTSFDEAHKAFAEEDLKHRESGVHDNDYDLADRSRQTKTRAQVIQEHLHQPVRPQPVPHGHVETHPLDGGITPVVPIAVEPFFLDATPVTNADFSKFVAATYYQTEAELYGWSFCLSSFVPSPTLEASQEVDPEALHWVAVTGATWKTPEGPGSSYKHREQHPVVHVSHRDAAEYCAWKGNMRLPGEREYEAAARTVFNGPTNRTLYVWGDEANWTLAAQRANLWGSDDPNDFPHTNHAQDGWRGTSPVKHYPPNAWGFYDLTGNVWEWMRGGKHKNRIVRGASYVDSLDGAVNHAATLGARATVHGTTTTGNVGFRCAKTPLRRIQHEYVSVAKESDDDDDSDEDEDEEPQLKKVVKKRERIYTEL